MKRNNTIYTRKANYINFIVFIYCVSWKLSVKKANNSGGKFRQERPLEVLGN